MAVCGGRTVGGGGYSWLCAGGMAGALFGAAKPVGGAVGLGDRGAAVCQSCRGSARDTGPAFKGGSGRHGIGYFNEHYGRFFAGNDDAAQSIKLENDRRFFGLFDYCFYCGGLFIKCHFIGDKNENRNIRYRLPEVQNAYAVNAASRCGVRPCCTNYQGGRYWRHYSLRGNEYACFGHKRESGFGRAFGKCGKNKRISAGTKTVSFVNHCIVTKMLRN